VLELTLVVATGPLQVPFGLRHLSPLLIDFATTYPDVTVELDFTDRKVNLIEEGIDVAIRIAGRLEPQDVARRISVCRSVVLASPDYLRRHGEPAHPAELAKHECLGYVPALRSAWPFLVDGQTHSFPVRGRLLANNGDALLDAAVRGLGITCPPTFIAAPAIEAGLVKPILTRYPVPELGIHALYPGSRYIPHRARIFVDYLVARIGPEPYWDDNFMAAGPPKVQGGSGAKRTRKLP
jgi:DNA-binding transcriptional LysR family regulator